MGWGSIRPFSIRLLAMFTNQQGISQLLHRLEVGYQVIKVAAVRKRAHASTNKRIPSYTQLQKRQVHSVLCSALMQLLRLNSVVAVDFLLDQQLFLLPLPASPLRSYSYALINASTCSSTAETCSCGPCRYLHLAAGDACVLGLLFDRKIDQGTALVRLGKTRALDHRKEWNMDMKFRAGRWSR